MATSDPLIAQIREAKRLAEAAFWSLLDLRIVLQDIESGERAQGLQNAGESRSGLLGVHDHYADHDDYQPSDSHDYGGEYPL